MENSPVEALEQPREYQGTNQAPAEPSRPVYGLPRAIPTRDISQDTAKFYDIGVDGDKITFPYPAGYKRRTLEEKKFWSEGALTGLFGQDKFNSGGRFVTITEGEFDAMAAYQMFGSKYPVVSVKSASTALKDCQAAFEWLDSFNSVVICFDNDEPGKQAAAKVAELFGPKAKVVKLSKYKDANEYLSQHASKEFVEAWWAAEKYVPDGIVSGATLWELVNTPLTKATVQYPYEGLNRLTYGIRPGELIMVTAGSGLGKSQFLREIVWQILCKTEDSVGMMFLEESVQKTAVSIMSLAANKPLHLPTTEYTPEEYKEAFDATLGTGRLFLFDHFGSSGVDNIVSRVRFLAKGLGCKYIFLDHISIVVSNQEQGDERKALDEIMTKLRMVVQETGICLICVSHLKRPEGRGHEEGAATSLAQLRGSGSIAQLSDIVIGLERNGQAEDEFERNTTHIRVLKNRFSGETGPAGAAVYSRDTGRMLEIIEDEAL